MAKPKKKESNYRAAPPFTGRLGCQRCDNRFDVVDLNVERRTVGCPICGENNAITEAIKRGR